MAVIVALFSVLFRVVIEIFFFLLEGPSSFFDEVESLLKNSLLSVCYILLCFVGTFLITACFCLLYNLLTKRLGGIQIELVGTGTEVRS